MREWLSQGLASKVYNRGKRLKAFQEVSERKQVGDTASLINSGGSKFRRQGDGSEL
jgi:hypothetical protein